MATLHGVISFTKKLGTVHGYSKTGTKKGKVFAATNRASDKSHFQTAASMVNVRNNASEFAGAGLQSKGLNAETSKQFTSVNGKNFHLLQKLFVAIIKLGIGIAGQRPFSLSLWKSLLQGFTFGRSSLKSNIIAAYTSTLNVGRTVATTIFPLIPANQVFAPRGATHFRLVQMYLIESDAAYDPDSKKYIPIDPEGQFPFVDTEFSAWLPVGVDVAVPTSLANAASTYTPIATDSGIVIVGIQFAQLVGTEYNILVANSGASVTLVG